MFYYLHRALFKLGFFKHVNMKLNTVISGKEFIIPIINQAGYYHLLPQEKWMVVLLQNLLQNNPGRFIDVGMNISQTLLKVKAIDSDRAYTGFEPNNFCAYYVRKLSEANHFYDVDIFPVGLFTENMILTLYMDKDISSGASILPLFRKNMTPFQLHSNVSLTMGDEILQRYTSEEIAVLKADVEGAELEVIKGCLQTIHQKQPFIILEILPVYSETDGNGFYRKSRQDELLSLLQNSKYKMYRILEDKMALQELTTVETHGNMHLTNYLFVPESKQNLLQQFSIPVLTV